MAQKTLKQKYLWETKEITLQEKGVFVKRKDFKEVWEYHIRYEDLGFTIVREKTEVKRSDLVTSIVALTISIFLAIYELVSNGSPKNIGYGIFGMIFFSGRLLMWRYNKRNKYICLKGGKNQLRYFANIPDERSVADFIESLQQRVRQRVKELILSQRELYSFHVFSEKLNWLVSVKAITEEEKTGLLKGGYDFSGNKRCLLI